MVLAVQAMAHARLLAADINEIESLRSRGLLASTGSLPQDFRTVSYLLSTVAPAVYMRQEHWVRMYFYMLRACNMFCSTCVCINAELRRLVAHQAARYSEACARLAHI
jgi:hypothetical protein